MREILFRGKRKDNGAWVEGAFLNDRDGAYYICPAATDISYGDNGNRRRIGCWYAVDPDTVGQYVGQEDQNGSRIFEGDVVDMSDEWWDAAGPAGHDSPYAVVEWVDGFCGFDPFSNYDCDCGVYIKASRCSVICNIHDNPELMEGQKR